MLSVQNSSLERFCYVTAFFQSEHEDKPFRQAFPKRKKHKYQSVLKLASLKWNQQFPELMAQSLMVFMTHQKGNNIWFIIVFRKLRLKKDDLLSWTSSAPYPETLWVMRVLRNQHYCFLLCLTALPCPQGQGSIQRYDWTSYPKWW